MLWLSWRQYRMQAIFAAGAFVALGVVLLYTGAHLLHLYHQSGIAACRATHGDCGPLIDDFTSHYPALHSLGALLIMIPAVLGVFWGAPLVARELESGTYQLAWTQSVTRTRWLATKVAMIAAGTLVTTTAFLIIIALWSSPLDKVQGNRFSPAMFAQRGVAPLAYAAFAFALGVLMGILIRRVIAAMAATGVTFFLVRVAVQQWIRPHFATALKISAPLFGGDASVAPGSWIVSSKVVNAAGQTVQIRRDVMRNLCNIPEGGFSKNAFQACTQRLGLHQILTVQPPNRYWSFQAWEAGIFVVLAVAAGGFAFWWVRRQVG